MCCGNVDPSMEQPHAPTNLFPSLCYLLSGFWLSTQTCHFDLIRCLGHVDPSMEQPHAPEKLFPSACFLLIVVLLSTHAFHFDLMICLVFLDHSREQPHAAESLKKQRKFKELLTNKQKQITKA